MLKTGVERKKNSPMDGDCPCPHDGETESVPRTVPFHQSVQTGAACAELGAGQGGADWDHGAGTRAGSCDFCILLTVAFLKCEHGRLIESQNSLEPL